jgi:YidC/Oxa1 family membrane protein insertase
MAVRQKILASQREAGVRPALAMLGLLHIPFGFGMYRVLHNMATLPVPSMENGGFLWFQDLTAPDPFYILSIVGPIVMFTMMRVRDLSVTFSTGVLLRSLENVLTVSRCKTATLPPRNKQP